MDKIQDMESQEKCIVCGKIIKLTPKVGHVKVEEYQNRVINKTR